MRLSRHVTTALPSAWLVHRGWPPAGVGDNRDGSRLWLLLLFLLLLLLLLSELPLLLLLLLLLKKVSSFHFGG